MKNQKKAIVIGRDAIYMTGLKHLLTNYGYRIEQRDYPEGEYEGREFLARLLVLDLEDVDGRALDLIRKVRKLTLHVPILGYFLDIQKKTLAEIKHLQIDGVLGATSTESDVKKAIEALERDDEYFDVLVHNAQKDFLKNLSKRQYQVYTLMIEGYGTKEIADSLSIAEKTVRNHVSNINRILGTTRRYQAVLKYFKAKS